MAKNKLSGVIVPTITPFDENGEIMEDALRAYLSFFIEKVHGISVCAVYGSGMLMRMEQRKKVAQIAVEVSRGKLPVSVFVGSPDTDNAVELAHHAEEIGASAISCVEPIYYRQVDEAIFNHYQALIQAVDIPVYAYDSPVFAGNQISLNVLQRLADAGLAGVITGQATYGIDQVWTVLRNIDKSGFDVFSIRDGLAVPSLMMGAVGFETGVGNFFPELVVELFDAVHQKNYTLATELQNRALKLRDISHSFGRNIPTLHALIKLRGFETGLPRRPFFNLSDAELSRLVADLKAVEFELPFQFP